MTTLTSGPPVITGYEGQLRDVVLSNAGRQRDAIVRHRRSADPRVREADLDRRRRLRDGRLARGVSEARHRGRVWARRSVGPAGAPRDPEGAVPRRRRRPADPRVAALRSGRLAGDGGASAPRIGETLRRLVDEPR